MLEAVLEPVLLRLEADQNPRGPTVSSDDDLLGRREAEVP